MSSKRAPLEVRSVSHLPSLVFPDENDRKGSTVMQLNGATYVLDLVQISLPKQFSRVIQHDN